MKISFSFFFQFRPLTLGLEDFFSVPSPEPTFSTPAGSGASRFDCRLKVRPNLRFRKRLDIRLHHARSPLRGGSSLTTASGEVIGAVTVVTGVTSGAAGAVLIKLKGASGCNNVWMRDCEIRSTKEHGRIVLYRWNIENIIMKNNY